MSGRGLVGLVTLAVVAVVSIPLFAQQAPTDPNYAEGRRLFETLEYEGALKALDQAVATFEAMPTDSPARSALLTSAYELRARSKFGLGDTDGTRADFAALLKLTPNYTLTGQVSPRVVALFDEVIQASVTSINLSVTPQTARVELDGVAAAPGTIRVAIGEHVVTAAQPGYRRLEQSITAQAGTVAEVALALERVSAVLNVLTVPSGVDVRLDTVNVGKTAAGPAPPQFAEAITRAGVASSDVSSVLSLVDIAPGTHALEFSRECFVTVLQRLPFDTPDDYTIGPVKLQPATARLSVTANDSTAEVILDGQSKGAAPFTMADLCQGEHTVELRSAVGRFATRVDARAGGEVVVAGVLTPAFVLLPRTGQAAGANADRGRDVERALAGLKTLAIFAAPAAEAESARESNRLPADWLAVDANGRPTGTTVPAQTTRADASTKLAEAFHAQGVASFTVLADGRVVLSLLASGSGEPDVLEMQLNNAASITALIGRLDRALTLFQPSLGIDVIDAADVAGAVVVAVDPRSASTGIQAGDVIVAVDGQAVADGAALEKLLAGRTAGQTISVELKDPAGANKRADIGVFLTPRVISLFDPDVLPNRTLLDVRARLAVSKDPLEQSVLRLNGAVALGRTNRWAAAREELQQVKLPDGPGVGEGAVHFLLGVAADRLGDRPGAEAEFKRAAASPGLLDENGPPVSDVAEAMLADLRTRAR